MNKEEFQLKVSEVLRGLEESGDIVLTTTSSLVTNKVVDALHYYVQDFLNDEEFNAILNSLNVLVHDIKLDSRDFQTIIGIEQEKLKGVFDKLNSIKESKR